VTALLGDILNLKHAAPQRAPPAVSKPPGRAFSISRIDVLPASQLAPDRSVLIAQARQAVLGGEGREPSGVESWISRSWRRCLQAGRSPYQPLAFDPVSAVALRRSREEHAALLRAARPVLDQLAHAIGGMGYFALVTDRRGVVLDVQGPVNHRDPRAHAIGRAGVDLSEASVGTTAIGAALAELRPVWLHRGEHFFDANGSYSCAGAPLFDPQAQCVGMLDLTGVDVPERPELRHVVARCARALEDALLQQQPHALLLRLNWPGARLGSEADGLMLIDGEGYVRGCNSAARQLVAMPSRPAGERLHCGDLLALDWPRLFDAASHGLCIELPLWSGLRLQAMATSRATAPSHATPPRNRPLRETEVEWIRNAVRAARGNVAQAARTLGISRATVYRKLGHPTKVPAASRDPDR
jgi:transcriptional regulator of acetoin/glycerol metabolism